MHVCQKLPNVFKISHNDNCTSRGDNRVTTGWQPGNNWETTEVTIVLRLLPGPDMAPTILDGGFFLVGFSSSSPFFFFRRSFFFFLSSSSPPSPTTRPRSSETAWTPGLELGLHEAYHQYHKITKISHIYFICENTGGRNILIGLKIQPPERATLIWYRSTVTWSLVTHNMAITSWQVLAYNARILKWD